MSCKRDGTGVSATPAVTGIFRPHLLKVYCLMNCAYALNFSIPAVLLNIPSFDLPFQSNSFLYIKIRYWKRGSGGDYTLIATSTMQDDSRLHQSAHANIGYIDPQRGNESHSPLNTADIQTDSRKESNRKSQK